MPNASRNRKGNTTARGLGWPHQQQVAALLRNLIDGTLCWWCGLPMFRDILRNWDKRKLQGDHSHARTHGGTRTDRLLHATCNEQRGDGTRDHLRPVLTGTHPSQWTPNLTTHGATSSRTGEPTDLEPRLMPWP